jgi:signal transduction histidine kinase
VQRLRQAQGLISDEIYLLYCSRDGSLWLGALNGLNQLSDGAATSYGAGEGLPRSTYLMQRAQGPNGELWFGNGSFMARVRNGVLAPLVPEPVLATDAIEKKKASQETIRGLEVVPVWVRSSDPGRRGLVLTNRHGQSVISDGTLQERLPKIPWEMVGSLLITHDGTLWTAGSNIGVVAYPAHGPPRSYTAAEGLDNNNVLSLAEDAQGNVWAGTISGMNRIRDGNIVRVISSPDVTSINPSADGSLWASSESGLIYVPSALTPIRLFTQRDGLPTNLIDGVAEDAEGYLWLGTEQGVVRVQKAYLLAPEHQPQMRPVVFGVGDGLHNAQLRLNSVFCSKDDDVWFVTLEELGMIDPHKKQANLLFPIHIDLVRIDDQDAAAPPIGSVTVPAGRHRITIDYTIPEFRIPDRIRFRYQLVGWDKDWIEAGTLRNATYTGIPSGHYVFRVTQSDGYGNWSSDERTMNIRVSPYFYQTAWFSTLIAFLIASFFWQLHRFRVARVSAAIDARMQERTRIARELHDTLLQGMLGISMHLYAASQQTFDPGSSPAILGRASQKLREIAEQSRRAVDDLRSLPSPDSLEATLSRLLHDLPAGIESRVHSAGSSMRLRPLVQTEIEQITREAIANAIRHSGGSSIRLDILYHYSYLFVSISDNGRGMQLVPEQSKPHSHWGITGMAERARSIGGRLRILPNEPRGTVVEVSLPGSLAYLRPTRGYISSFWRRVVGVRKPVNSPPTS